VERIRISYSLALSRVAMFLNRPPPFSPRTPPFSQMMVNNP